MEKSNDMCRGNLVRGILFFSVPLMLSNLLLVLFNMADIAVVGHFAGQAALGAVGSVSTLILLFTGLIIGLSSGVNVVTAYFLGAKKQKDAAEAVHTALILSLFAAAFITSLSEAGARVMLSLMKTKAELMEGALLYFRIYMLSMPALSLYNFGNAVLSAAGNTKKALLFLSIAGVLNIFLNLLFVIAFKMDAAGVAIASVISQYVSAILIASTLLKGCHGIKLHLSHLKLNAHKARQILKIGIPSGLQYAIFAFANIFIQSGVNTFSAAMVAGNAAAANADPLIYDIMAAFYTAGSSFIAQNHGAGNRKRVLSSYFLSMGYSFLTGLFLGVLLLTFARNFLFLFSIDETVVSSGLERISVMALSYCVSAFMDSSIAASRGLGKTFVPSLIVILGSCVFRIIWLYTVFAYFKTIESLFLLYVFSWIITSIAEIAYFIFCFRREMPIK